MDEVVDIKNIIAANIAYFRKAEGLTQSELAALLNYSDKAVSKWERAESVPDITVLKQLAKLFKITLDEMTEKNDFASKAVSSENTAKKRGLTNLLKSHKLIIPILSAGIVWLIATIVFVFLQIFDVNWRTYLCFFYAIPVSLIVLVVFNAIWGNRILSSIIVSLLIWTVPLAIYMSLNKLNDRWQLFLISIPLQVLIVLWYIMRIKADKTKEQKQKTD